MIQPVQLKEEFPPTFVRYLPASSLDVHFPLSNGNRLELRVDRAVTPQDFDRINQMLDLMRESLVDRDANKQHPTDPTKEM